jgi:hypothetical protein
MLINKDGTASLVCTIHHPKHSDSKPLPLTTTDRSGELGILIKWMHLANAKGHSGRLVLIVAIPLMPPNTYFHVEVPCMTESTNVLEYGHLYFCSSRAGNEQLVPSHCDSYYERMRSSFHEKGNY